MTFLLITVAAMLSFAEPVVVDRIAVSVATQAITLSEVKEEVAVTAFMNGEKPDYSPGVLRRAVDRLVDQALIRREIDLGRYAMPGPDVASSMLAALQKQHGGRTGLDRALASYGLTRQELQAHLAWQATLLQFIEMRFRPAVQVTSEDVQKYFHQHYATRTESGRPIALDSMRAQIENELTASRADEEMEQWLKDTRKQTAIVVRDESVGKEIKP
jgi:hypothetical protein